MHERVGTFLQDALRGEEPLLAALDRNAGVTFLVPVQGEPVHRLFELFESIADMSGASERAEVLCLINNPPDDGTERRQRMRAMNELVLSLPVWANQLSFDGIHRFPEEIRIRAARVRERLRIHAIDKSSERRELSDANIGRARNRLLAEAVLRYERAGKNGLLVMTDADARFPDRAYLEKLFALFESEPDLIGVSGGIDLVFDPDTRHPVERERLLAAFDRFVLERSWQEIAAFLERGERNMAPDQAFYGSHIICRSAEAALAGGFKPLAKHEDAHFGEALRNFARAKGKRVGNAKRLLRATVALRESDRTAASLLPMILRTLQPGRVVRDPETGREFSLTHEDAERVCGRLEATKEGRALLRELRDLSRLLYRDVLSA